jgi:hypothetical protein
MSNIPTIPPRWNKTTANLIASILNDYQSNILPIITDYQTRQWRKEVDYNFLYDGTHYVAINGSDGKKEFPSDTLHECINDAIQSMNGNWVHTVKIWGDLSLTDTVNIDRMVNILGNGCGLGWNKRNNYGTVLRWNGGPNKPMFKVTGENVGDAELEENAIQFSNIALRQNNSESGVVGIQFGNDGGEVTRRVFLDRVHIIDMKSYCIDYQALTFDIMAINLCCIGGGDHCIIMRGGTPAMTLLNPLLFSNTRDKYSIYNDGSNDLRIFGGEIGGGNDGNGIYIKSPTFNHGFWNLNLEGDYRTTSIGLHYNGTALHMLGGQIRGWGTGVKVGNGDATAVKGLYIDSRFSENTYDLELTEGANRSTQLGPIASESLNPSKLRDSRYNNQNFPDLRLTKQPPYSVETMVVGTSPFEIINTSGYNRTIIVSGGTVTSIGYKNWDTGTVYDLGVTSGMFTLTQGARLVVTYSVVPNIYYIDQ